MTIQSETVAHNDLVNGSEIDLHSHSSSGSSTSIFYAVNTDSTNLITSLSTMSLGNEIKKDSIYTHTGNGEITVTQAGNYFFAWSVVGTGASNRVEIRSELQVNSTKVKGTSCYTARNSAQNTGGVQGFHFQHLSANDIVRVQSLRDGSTANKIVGDCSLYIESK